jgi:hypothetical protein
MSENHVARIPSGLGREIRVTVTEFRARPSVTVRLWTEHDGCWSQGPGINIWPDQVPAVIDGLKAALAEIFGDSR